MSGKKKGMDFSGLDDFNVSDLMGGAKPGQSTGAGKLLMVPLEKIHDDPNQSRLNYDQKKIDELADSMRSINPATGKPRGIKQPLSLRPHPDKPGEYISNGGHRRRRAAAQAGIPEAPAFVDEDADGYDNVVDNIQREGLNALEMAHFIQKCISGGDKKGEVAKRLGKPASFVSDHIIFFEMAESVRDLYDSGRCQSMQALALLHRAHKKFPDQVDDFCESAPDDVSTGEVRAFCDSLKADEKPPKISTEFEPAPPGQAAPGAESSSDREDNPTDSVSGAADVQNDSAHDGAAPRDPEPDDQENTYVEPEVGSVEEQGSELIANGEAGEKLKKAMVQIRHDDRAARLIMNRRASYGLGWIKYDDDGHEQMVDLKDVSLVAVIEA